MPKYGSTPARFVVYQDCKPQKGKSGTPYTARLGGYDTLPEARQAITDNERAMTSPRSYGGLLDWGDDLWERRYRIFEATYQEAR